MTSDPSAWLQMDSLTSPHVLYCLNRQTTILIQHLQAYDMECLSRVFRHLLYHTLQLSTSFVPSPSVRPAFIYVQPSFTSTVIILSKFVLSIVKKKLSLLITIFHVNFLKQLSLVFCVSVASQSAVVCFHLIFVKCPVCYHLSFMLCKGC